MIVEVGEAINQWSKETFSYRVVSSRKDSLGILVIKNNKSENIRFGGLPVGCVNFARLYMLIFAK